MNKIIKLFFISLLLALGILIYKVSSRYYLMRQLYSAIWHNDTNKVKEWIEKGADVNGSGGAPDSQSMLRTAIHSGNSEIVALLLDNGAYTKTAFDLSIFEALTGATSFQWEKHDDKWIKVRKKDQSQKNIIPLLIKAKAQTKYPEIIIAILTDDLDRVKELFTKDQVSTEERKLKDIASALSFSGDQQIISYVSNKIPDIKQIMDKYKKD